MAIRATLAVSCATLLVPLWAQPSGSISGIVSLEQNGSPLHGASVLLIELGHVATTAADGSYSFRDVPVGKYRVYAHMHSLLSESERTAEVRAGESAAVNFSLSIRTVQEEVTVTASARPELVFDSISSVHSFDAFELATLSSVSLGEAFDQVGSGIAKREFGPGASRPIIRGFDGDRVLIMEDGIRTGSLSSQSGDHGEAINIGLAHRVEIVKGPAALLYSGSAVGGAINVIDRHLERHYQPHQGLHGYLGGSGGTTNALGGTTAGFEYGSGPWLLWGDASATRSGDYNTPTGPVFNSRTRLLNGAGGIGWFGSKTYFIVDAKIGQTFYGVPFAEQLHGSHGHDEHEDEHGDDMDPEEDEEEHEEEHEEEELERVALDGQRNSYRVDWGLLNLGGPIGEFSLSLNYVQWRHDEREFFETGDEEIGTTFRNDQFVYRGQFEQRRRGAWGGRFGFWGLGRAYEAVGEEALSPPVEQRGLAFFGLEEFEFERFKIQAGARLETQRYLPSPIPIEEHDDDAEDGDHEDGDHEHGDHAGTAPEAVERTFTGLSTSVGIHVDTWNGGALTANYTRTFRAPSLEELYNFGPHVGTLAFEIGDSGLRSENGQGFEGSLRHKRGRIQGQTSFFLYDFSDFIFPFADPGEIVDGLQVIEFTQLDARYAGAEAELRVELRRNAWLKTGLDFVDARSTETNTPLPRIPPLRGKFGLEFSRGGLRIEPELVLAGAQNDTFVGETRTPGYAVVNLAASYIYARAHAAHQFSVRVFNAGNRLYRNHSSFIKDLAPEMGRGVRFGYTLRFF